MATRQLSDDAINNLVLSKLDQNESIRKGVDEFSGYDDWPADAQLGLLSMAWALGPAFAPGFPKFRAACAAVTAAADADADAAGHLQEAADAWNQAADQSHIDDTNNPGLRPRNQADHTLFSNAAQIVFNRLDFDVLQFSVVSCGH